ncbi:carbamoyltransferase C-terminal domain-containing protein [Streptomyces beigongshangae]|uniref:carbamoyltransferase C-terminal domain-containing protein n=1 Tax=Streptomyces beigongshangae TaxID=2841597 RepID=UPI001C85F51F|nr:carbamoyltransferase C-terminal domain-containing protein [Streptomyces sp. REN17]
MREPTRTGSTGVGSSEVAPALGAHSILANPRTTASSEALNQTIKHREPFKPFAPAVFADQASTWFDLDVASPFMLLAPPEPTRAPQSYTSTALAAYLGDRDVPDPCNLGKDAFLACADLIKAAAAHHLP